MESHDIFRANRIRPYIESSRIEGERPSTAGSGASGESKNEDNVKSLCESCVSDCFPALGESFRVLSWNQDLKI